MRQFRPSRSLTVGERPRQTGRLRITYPGAFSFVNGAQKVQRLGSEDGAQVAQRVHAVLSLMRQRSKYRVEDQIEAPGLGRNANLFPVPAMPKGDVSTMQPGMLRP